MNYHQARSNISNELSLCRYHRGVKLIEPNQKNHATDNSVASILQLPMNIYFLGADSTILEANENCVIASRVASIKDLLGKTVLDICPVENARQIMTTDEVVVNTNSGRIVEEDMALITHGDVKNYCLSFKMPWYNNENKIIGVFGYSVYFGRDPFSEGLSKIAQLGLLSVFESSNDARFFLDNYLFDGVYFSKREKECLYYLVRARSSKEIAKSLGLSYRTIEYYIDNIKEKMNVNSRAELIDKLVSKFFYGDDIDLA